MKSSGKRSNAGDRGKRSTGGSSKNTTRKGSSPKSGSSRFKEDGPGYDRRSQSSDARTGKREFGETKGSRPARGGGKSNAGGAGSRSAGYGKGGGRAHSGTKKPFERSEEFGEKRSYTRSAPSERNAFERRDDDRPKRSYSRNAEDGEKRSYSRTSSGERKPTQRRDDDRPKRSYSRNAEDGEKRPYTRSAASSRGSDDDRPKRSYTRKSETGERTSSKWNERSGREKRPSSGDPQARGRRTSEVRLNKFLSNAGIASRRDADKLIELGLVSVNGKVILELGHKINPAKDVVRYDNAVLKPEPMRYVLLNKPKDYMTTLEETDKRKSVMALIDNACQERIYPVGRLDRQTTGLLLFTNDGEIAKRLTNAHLSIPKLYHVETVEKIRGEHLDAFRSGVELEDGFAKVEDVAFVNDDTHQVGMRIHSGRSRIVRHLFEHFGYTIKKLDRVMYAGLTKKDLPRGRYRHLTEQEVNFLRMIR